MRSQADVGSLLPLTSQQHRLLSAVEGLTATLGAPPSLDRLAEAVGLSSTATVRAHIKRLEAKGYVRREPGVHYGLTVLVPSAGASVVEPRPVRKAVARGLTTAELEAELQRRGVMKKAMGDKT